MVYKKAGVLFGSTAVFPLSRTRFPFPVLRRSTGWRSSALRPHVTAPYVGSGSLDLNIRAKDGFAPRTQLCVRGPPGRLADFRLV